MSHAHSTTRGAIVALSPDGIWCWVDNPILEISVERGAARCQIDGQPILHFADIARAIEKAVVGKGYRHCPAATQSGVVEEGRAVLDRSSLSKGIFVDGERVATSRTHGTFSINARTPSVIPGTPGTPDGIGIHSGRWRVKDPGMRRLVESARAPRAPGPEAGAVQSDADSRPSDNFKFILSIQINDGPLQGLKARQDVTVEFQERSAHLTSQSTWYGTKWKGEIFTTIVADSVTVPQIEQVSSSCDKVRFRLRGSAKTSLIRHLGDMAGKWCDTAAYWLGAITDGSAGSVALLLLGEEWCQRAGIQVGKSIAERATPNIDYDLRITIDRNGHGRIQGGHNNFPSYWVLMEDLKSMQTRILHKYSHPKQVSAIGGVDLRPIVSVSDLRVKLAALLTWHPVDEPF